MRSDLTRQTAARFSFIIGLLLMIPGVVFSPVSLEGGSRVPGPASFLFALFGAFRALRVIGLGKTGRSLVRLGRFFVSGEEQGQP